ncbi:MAG TPA: hypothetical protein VG389_21045 [Myxococcota bacterium]|jgi:hypothetical protein|nr:hypothetical protein [Myxococcota bacterium]
MKNGSLPRLVAAIAAAVALSALGAARAKPADRHVLVLDSAALRVAASPAAPHARVAGDGAPAGTRHAFRLVRELPDAVEVESIDDAAGARTCYEDVAGLRALALRLFVARADLLSVTTREVHAKYKDGTGLTLAAGVAVAPPAPPGGKTSALLPSSRRRSRSPRRPARSAPATRPRPTSTRPRTSRTRRSPRRSWAARRSARSPRAGRSSCTAPSAAARRACSTCARRARRSRCSSRRSRSAAGFSG